MACSCGFPSCSHVVLADVIRAVSNLTDQERVTILKVLAKDELIKREQHLKVMHLKAELQNLRRKGALRPSADWDNTGPDPDRSCGRCRVELGRVINRGAYCRSCRLKVCKSCREYSFRTSDWVCTVCHKRMEIQAASGEWMNEFVRRPSRRRDNRVFVPTAEIIKRTIRRSWTISNPTPRWNTPRNAPEMRPYSSLPRGQDITNYPSLQQQHQSTTLPSQPHDVNCPSPKRHSPARRTHSEDVYPERDDVQRPSGPSNPPSDTTESSPSKSPISPPQRSPRINPLILYAQKDKTVRTRKKAQKVESSGEGGTSSSTCSKGKIADEARTGTEKRVSFDSCARDLEEMPPRSPKHINANLNRATSLIETPSRLPRRVPPFHATRSLQERTVALANITDDLSIATRNSTSSPETSSSGGGAGSRDERDFAPLELCDIEPLSGTVFRKVTVRRRRQDMRKMAAVDSGWRRNESDLLDVLAPEGDDYKLVFLSSDSSSKEEDVDDNDSSSTASSFPIDECDWDYFEPGTVAKPVLSWNSPFGSPRVYRRSLIDSPIGSPLVYRKTTRESDTGTDDDYARLDTGSPASSDSLFASKRDSEEGSNDAQIDKGMEDVALQCKHKAEREIHPVPPCRSCGASTQYIPIPVPVPIPVPIPTLWTAQEALKFYGLQQQVSEQTLARLRIFPRNLWPFLNTVALSWPLMGGAGEPISVQPTQSSEYDSASEASRRADAPDYEAFAMRENMNECNVIERSTDSGNAREEEKPNSPPYPQQIPEDEQPICGYLESENRFDDSSSSSTETDDSEYNEKRKTCVTRVYNVNGRDGNRESDDALPSSNLSSCDEDDARASPGSAREEMTSSWSADTDSDDTGTDQKSKRFSKVFVVNRNVDSSSEQHSSSSESDTSDDDTDTELDCTVVLQNIKYINQDDERATELVENEVNNSIGSIDEINENETKDDVENEDNAVSINEIDEQYNRNENSLRNSKHDNFKMNVSLNDLKEMTTLSGEKIEECKHNSIRHDLEEYDSDMKMLSSASEKSGSSSDKNVENENTSEDSTKEKIEEVNISGEITFAKPSKLENSNDVEKLAEDMSENIVGDSSEVVNEEDVKVTHNVPRGCVIEKFEERYMSNDENVVEFCENSSENFEIEKSEKALDEKVSSRSSSSECSGSSDVDQENLESGDAVVPKGDISALPSVANPACGDQQGTVSSQRNGVPPHEDIRSVGPVSVVGESEFSQASSSCCGAQAPAPGVSVTLEQTDASVGRHAARYTSLVMITQEPPPQSQYQQVSVVTTDTTTFVSDNDVIVQHTNWQKENGNEDAVSGNHPPSENVTVITGAETLSAFEEGLADDDSWLENISHDEDDFGQSSITEDSSSGEEVTLTCSVAVDNEDELRGYHRAAIDFTLHTIVEESCEESEVEQMSSIKKPRPPSTTDLEKYFFFGLGDGNIPSINTNREDAFSETSSVYSEGVDSLGGPEEQFQEDNTDPAELASSRLEKYFLSGFMGFSAERRDSDGSVGSDSEGRPSPEQRRKRLVRARGTGRSHSSSLDNLISNPELLGNDQQNEVSNGSEISSSSDSDTYDETTTFEKSDGQFDTVKRKKTKKQKANEEMKCLESTQELNEDDKSGGEHEDGHKTPQPENTTNLVNNKNQQSRDSGFIGSCDDLLKEQRDSNNSEIPNKSDMKVELGNIIEEKKEEKPIQHSVPPATSLTRKDSFNNWSSDEETNLMMCKMRQFFKTMIANSQCSSSKPTTPNMSNRTSPSFPIPSPRARNRCKPPQLVYFENELTRLMKTVPGIRDDQVREIVEYLSSEDTWSDSYDSSDYTSSDLEGATTKSALQQQISDSCKQIINKFDKNDDEEGDEGDGGIVDEKYGINRETAFVYQKLVASFEKMASGNNVHEVPCPPTNSPPLIARVMHHIGSRLVALMHEVSSGESHTSNSPKTRHYHRRLQQKLSNASSTTTDDDSTSDTNLKDTLSALDDNFSYSVLSRSKSHDLLMGETKTTNSTGSGDIIVEEREASDCERFSWRGSFESALLATDSRNRLSIIGSEGSASASALAIAAKRRSAGDLIFSHKSLSREQLDRVRSCGSIGGASSEDKLWVSTSTRPNRRRSSVPDASCGSGGSADGEDDDDEEIGTALPRNLQTGAGTTNSLPRLPTNAPSSSMLKAQSHHFLPQNAKSARYRPPGFNRLPTTVPKRAVSAPGLQPSHQRRGRRSQQNVPSESAKKLIKPNVDDGITDTERIVFLESDSHRLDEKNIPGGDLYISKDDIELEEGKLKTAIDEEKDNDFPLNGDNEVSSITDDISITGSDVSGRKKKGKKIITNFLHIGRKKKNQDSVSMTNSTVSIEKPEKIEEPNTPEENKLENASIDRDSEEPSNELVEEVLILDVTTETVSSEEVAEQNDEIQETVSSSQDIPDQGTASSGAKKKTGRRIVSIFQSIRRKSKGKKTDDDKSHRAEDEVQSPSKNADEISVNESEVIKSDEVTTASNEMKQIYDEEKSDESPGIDQNTTEKHKKKFPWRSSTRKNKLKGTTDETKPVEVDDNEDLSIDSEKKNSARKSFFEKVGSLKRSSKSPSSGDETKVVESDDIEDSNIDASKKTVFEKVGSLNTSSEPPTAHENEHLVDEVAPDDNPHDMEVSPQENEHSDDNVNVNKKKKILVSLRVPKSGKPEKELHQTKCTPSIFSACTHSNVSPDQERKLSTDSAEVKTIASSEGKSRDREVTPIRIIRNDFFPNEVLDSSKKPNNVTQEDDIEEKIEEASTEEIGNDIEHQQVSRETTNLENKEENTEGDVTAADQESPVFDKKYGIIEIDDFSESLHTLVDDEDPNFILIASSTVTNEIIAASKDSCEKNGKDNEQSIEDNSLPEGRFRTSCNLSIVEPNKDIGDESSSDTLIESVLSRTIEKSTDTLTDVNNEPLTQEWVEITNIDDIDDSKFNYIYKTTAKLIGTGVQAEFKPETSQEVSVVSLAADEPPSSPRDAGDLPKGEPTQTEHSESGSCETCGKTVKDNEGSNTNIQKTKCVCTTLTRVRRSVGELEEGNVKSKVAILAQSEHPIILPFKKDDIIISEAHSSPTLGSVKSGSKSASPIAAKSRSGTLSSTNSEWQNAEEDIDRMMVMQGRSSLSNLGLRSDSMASVYSGAGEGRYGTVAVKGQVEFGLQYNYKAGALEIHVKQCKDLAAVDFKRNRSDPYVKVYLLPDKSKGGKRKTKVKKHTLNPVFDETLKFHISLNGLETRTLWLTVWHSDMFGRNDFLGEVMMALENKVFDDPTPKLYNLQERTEPFDDAISFKGDIIVCLKFVPPDMTVQKKGKRSRGTLQVLVKEAKYLTAYKANGTSDPFCKSYLLPDKGRNSKQKTHVVKKTINPVWNHTFIYDDVTLQELAERCLELTVWDHDRIASNEFLGGVRFSLGTGKHYGKSVEWMDSTGKEMTLWKSMLERPNFWVEGCLSLRPTLDARAS